MTPQQLAYDRYWQEVYATSAAMERLLAAGLSPIPLCRPRAVAVGDGKVSCSADWHEGPCPDAGKRVLVSGYPAFAGSPLAPDVARRFFASFENPNIGLVVPDGSVAIDADSPEAECEVSEHIGDVKTVQRASRPGRGSVWLFRLPPGVTCAFKTHTGRSKAIDILPAGRYFVTPPSVHRTGHVFQWAPGQGVGEIAGAELPSRALALLTPAPPVNEAVPVNLMHTIVIGPEPSAKVRALLRTRSKLRKLWTGEGKRYGDTSASGIDLSIAIYLLEGRCRPEEVVVALALRPGVHKCDIRYLRLTVDKAMRFLEAK